MIKQENNKNTYRWEAPDGADPQAYKAQCDNMFSELTIEEADDDQELDNKMMIAAKALGRNERTSEKKINPPEEFKQPEEEVLNDNPYLEEENNKEEVQVEKVEQQDHYSSGKSGYTHQLCHNKQFESVIEEVEAENKEYSDELNSGGDLSFDRANTAN